MDMRTDGIETRKGARAPGGRKGKDGTEEVPQTRPIKEALADLLKAKKKADDARDKLNEEIRKVAEQSNMNASVVRRFVNASQKDSKGFDAERRKAEQFVMAFDEIGFQGEISREVQQ